MRKKAQNYYPCPFTLQKQFSLYKKKIGWGLATKQRKMAVVDPQQFFLWQASK